MFSEVEYTRTDRQTDRQTDWQTNTTLLLCIYVNFVCGRYTNLAQHIWKESVVCCATNLHFVHEHCLNFEYVQQYTAIARRVRIVATSAYYYRQVPPSVCLSVCTYNSDSNWTDFHENWCCVHLWKLLKTQIRLKLDTNIEHITRRPR
jgi:hypothetical protein